MIDQSINPKFDFLQFYKNDNLEDGELRDTYVREAIGIKQKSYNFVAHYMRKWRNYYKN